jgi:arylsulfatase A-like enzyme
MFARGPGIKPGSTVLEKTLHVDIAVSIVTLAGGPKPEIADGQQMPIPGMVGHPPTERMSFGAEYWGQRLDEMFPKIYYDYTWRSLKVDSEKGSFKYVVCKESPDLFWASDF